MASPVPAKSQPLHNFSLPHLKWKNHRSGRGRPAGEASTSSPPPPQRSPASHAYTHTPSPLRQSSPSYCPRRPSPLYKHSPIRESESESEPSSAVLIAKPKSTKSIDNSKGKRSNNKISIRFRNNGSNGNNAAVTEENHNRSSEPVTNVIPTSAPESAAEEDDSSPKTWNLRPRRPPAPMNYKQTYGGGLPKTSSSPLPENKTGNGSELKTNDQSYTTTYKKPKFSISLTRDEIEEDIFALTGGKPSRRPKKRPRTVQKQLDTLFPGLWLGSITADSYKVSEAPLKG